MDNQSSSISPIVLLVEDRPSLSKMYTLKFTSEKVNVIPVSTADSAINALNDHKVDIILLDLILPGGVSGVDLLRKIRNMDNCKNIPVIVLTNVADPVQKAQSLELGAKEYLVKAMQTPESVVVKVREHLGLSVEQS